MSGAGAWMRAVGPVAGFSARHPFDHVWNHAVGRLVGGPPLPPNPRRRRDAFKLATAWLAPVGILFTAGASTAALVIGAMLLAACATMTATNLCLPSELFASLEHRRTSTIKPIAT